MIKIEDGQIRLPVKVEDVTARWLTEALALNHPGVEVISARVEKVLWGTATKVPVRVECNRAGRDAQLPNALLIKGGFSEHRHLFEFLQPTAYSPLRGSRAWAI